jgi:hypothetical protein
LWAIVVLALLAISPSHAAGATLVIRYFPSGEIYEYRWELLQLALSHVGYPAQDVHMLPTPDLVSQDRAAQLLASDGLDVVCFGSSPEREKELLPVRIDILRGIIGYRELVVRAGDEARISAMNAAEMRDKVQFGLNEQWADLPIMTASGYHVTGAPGYENLFTMLAAGRFDAFPRGLNEIRRDLDLRNAQTPALVVEHRHAFYYPYPVYFWVRKDNAALAALIKRGLEKALADGSMKELFLRFHAVELDQLTHEHRDVIRLANPRLPEPGAEPDTSWWWVQ